MVDKRLTEVQNNSRTKSRASAGAFTEDRSQVDAALLSQLAVQQGQLPKFPEKQGFHRIYLSTTNQYDPIAERIRLGYRPVKLEDLPEGFAEYSKSGRSSSTAYEGCFSVNEMVLCEIEDVKYQTMRRYYEYDLPNQQEEAIKATADNFRSGRGERLGGIEEATTEILENHAPPPPSYD